MKRITTISFICAVLGVWLFVAGTPAQAEPLINTNWRGLAIKGYDPVAYFTLGVPTKGKRHYEFQWRGAKWRFVNQDHLEIFKQNPEQSAPRYGGY